MIPYRGLSFSGWNGGVQYSNNIKIEINSFIITNQMPKCEQEGCTKKYPIFNIKGGKGRFCAKHKTVDMIDVKNKRCEHEECDIIRPPYDVKGGKGRFCAKHKTSDMIDIKSKHCEQDGCTLQPSFDIKGGKGRFCSIHKIDSMIDVKHKVCEYKGCIVHPSFGSKGGKACFCVKHKTEDMVDLISRQCEYPGCGIGPSYDNIGGKGRFCIKHKTSVMVDVRSKRCDYEGCIQLNPIYGVYGVKSRYCFLHKTNEMINVKSKRCEQEECTSQPSFDVKGGKGRFCILHKVSDMVDVKHKLCDYAGCMTRSYYGKAGLPVSHCFQHREAGMIRKSNAKCVSCKELAIWGVNWIPRHCDAHKTEEDENLVERPCSSCSLLYVLDKTNRCENCNPESWAVARLAKQNALMDYLENWGLSGSSTDKPLEDSLCGKERPDRVYDLGDKIVILECDEHQHRERACLCEQTRMVNIGQSFGGIPVYFLRWNPDEYRSEKGLERLSNRHKLCGDLIADIQAGRTRLPVALVAALYLYYDGWSSLAEESWKVLTPILSVEHSS